MIVCSTIPGVPRATKGLNLTIRDYSTTPPIRLTADATEAIAEIAGQPVEQPQQTSIGIFGLVEQSTQKILFKISILDFTVKSREMNLTLESCNYLVNDPLDWLEQVILSRK